ncbi:MAG: F0F1 ATP synthase subunit delta [Candidatus Saccharimonadales bacterium]
MAVKLSRRKLAVYVADHVKNGTVPAHVMSEVAAYLVESHRLREATLVVRTIEEELEQRGVVVADVTSAFPLDDTMRALIQKQLSASQQEQVSLRETVDPKLLGGVRLQTPSQTLDATVAHKLNQLRLAKR